MESSTSLSQKGKLIQPISQMVHESYHSNTQKRPSGTPWMKTYRDCGGYELNSFYDVATKTIISSYLSRTMLKYFEGVTMNP